MIPIPNQAHDGVLVVDDDSLSLMMTGAILEEAGYPVRTAVDGESALALLTGPEGGAVRVVLTDYLMPGIDGLALLAAVRALDESRVVVIMSSHSERAMLSASMRGGALDFVEKPIDSAALLATMARAWAEAHHRRDLATAARQLREIARVQQRLVPARGGAFAASGGVQARLDTQLHPIHEAGGDFIHFLRREDGRSLIVIGDVSGHGVQEGFVAAYVQGVVKGMASLGASVEAIAGVCNRFLLHEWQAADGLGTPPMSVAALFVEVDWARQRLTLHNYGSPPPILVDAQGRQHPLGNGGTPLGWFEAPDARCTIVGLPESGSLWCWTDGLETIPWAPELPLLDLARALMEANPGDPVPVGAASDDLLASHLSWETASPAPASPAGPPPAADETLLRLDLAGEAVAQIDRLQTLWELSLRRGLPGLREDRLFDMLLTLREAVLNALIHGCGSRAELEAELEIRRLGGTSEVQVRLVDPGPGYDLGEVRQRPDRDLGLGDAHRGLSLIQGCPDRCEIRRRGAELLLTFDLNKPPAYEI